MEKKKRGKMILFLIRTAAITAFMTLIILNICGYKPMYVWTDSMEPVIKTHQFILGKRISADTELRKNDIVSYTLPYSPFTITHRIVEVYDDCYVLKGDHNSEKDPYLIKPEWIKYKIIRY